LIADHAEGYAQLLVEELGQQLVAWRVSALLYAAALCCLGVAGVLGGVAAMLWSVTPQLDLRLPWVLLACPLVFLIVGGCCWNSARSRQIGTGADRILSQVKQDVAMLRAYRGV
jgi:hypothetical protein